MGVDVAGTQPKLPISHFLEKASSFFRYKTRSGPIDRDYPGFILSLGWSILKIAKLKNIEFVNEKDKRPTETIDT